MFSRGRIAAGRDCYGTPAMGNATTIGSRSQVWFCGRRQPDAAVTFAPVTTEAAQHYGVSEDAIGWLAQIFPLLYVVLAIPAGCCSTAGCGRCLSVRLR